MKMFGVDKKGIIGLPYGEKNYDVKPFSSNTGALRTDRRTEFLYINIARQYADAR